MVDTSIVTKLKELLGTLSGYKQKYEEAESILNELEKVIDEYYNKYCGKT